MGAAGESAWNTIVADEATRVLRAHGLSVAREPADFEGTFAVRSAVFIHFDGTDPACGSKASIGYHTQASRPLANQWRRAYGAFFPFGFMPDNFTKNLSDYYGFRQVRARNGAVVLELGEVTCPSQRSWLAPRLKQIADLIANVLMEWLHRRNDAVLAH